MESTILLYILSSSNMAPSSDIFSNSLKLDIENGSVTQLPEIVIGTGENDSESDSESDSENNNPDEGLVDEEAEASESSKWKYVGQERYEFAESIDTELLINDLKNMIDGALAQEKEQLIVEIRNSKGELVDKLEMNDDKAFEMNYDKAFEMNGDKAFEMNGDKTVEMNGDKAFEMNDDKSVDLNEDKLIAEEYTIEIYKDDFYTKVGIKIGADKKAPVIKYLGEETILLSTGRFNTAEIIEYIKSYIDIDDNTDVLVDGDLEIDTKGLSNDSPAGIYAIEIKVADNSGNESEPLSVPVKVFDEIVHQTLSNRINYSSKLTEETISVATQSQSDSENKQLAIEQLDAENKQMATEQLDAENKQLAKKEVETIQETTYTMSTQARSMNGFAKVILSAKEAISKLFRATLGKSDKSSLEIEAIAPTANIVEIELDAESVGWLALDADSELSLKTNFAEVSFSNEILAKLLEVDSDIASYVFRLSDASTPVVDVFFKNDKGKSIRIPANVVTSADLLGSEIKYLSE
ncbi:hypothetical protein AN643_00220 [Candidatus Epulonipiscioides saccharophilum]|nr:hypothetical protein AN643_00220 [Epulopiscium sp. SCG-B10WGA-EpuloB]